MKNVNIAQIVAQVWEQEMQEAPYPSGLVFFEMLTGRRRSYRAQLDDQPLNFYGKVIPRGVILRRNLRALGPIRLNPGRLPV